MYQLITNFNCADTSKKTRMVERERERERERESYFSFGTGEYVRSTKSFGSISGVHIASVGDLFSNAMN
jgi:hypothetical protein